MPAARDERSRAGARTSRWYHDPVRPLDERGRSFRERDDGGTGAGGRDVAGGASGPGLAKAYRPHDVEGPIYERWLAADVFAPDGAGSPGGLVEAALRDHPAAPQRHRLAPPGPRPAEHGRGPHDPPRPDAAAGPRSACPASTTPRSPPSSCSTGSSPRRARPGRASAASATSSGCGASSRDPRRHPRPAAARRRLARLGPPPRSPWTSVSAGAVREAFTRLYREGLAYRTEALINWCPGCRTSVSDLEVIPTPEIGHALDGPLPPGRRGHRRARPGAGDRRRHDAPRDDPRRHRRRRPPRRPPLRATSSGGRVRIPFVERDVPVIADPSSTRPSGPAP